MLNIGLDEDTLYAGDVRRPGSAQGRLPSHPQGRAGIAGLDPFDRCMTGPSETCRMPPVPSAVMRTLSVHEKKMKV